MKNRMKQREIVLAMATVAVILGALVYTQIVEPQLKHRKQLRRTLADTQLQVLKIQRDLHRRNAVNQQYKQITPLLSDSFEETQAISVFLRQIRDRYTALGLRPNLVKQQPITHEKGHTVLSIRLDLNARMNQFLRFLESMQNEQDAIAVRRCEIKARDERDSISASLLITKIVAVRIKEKDLL